MKRKMLVIVAMIAMIFSLSVVSAKEVEVNDAATLLAAFKNAESGDVVKLIDNITYTLPERVLVSTDVTLNMNNHNIDFDGASVRSFTVQDGSLNIIGKGTISHLEHNALNVRGTTDKTKVNYSTLKVGKDVTVNGLYGIAVFYDPENKKIGYGVNVEFAGKIESTEGGITINGNLQNAEGAPVINILDGAVINSKKNWFIRSRKWYLEYWQSKYYR